MDAKRFILPIFLAVALGVSGFAALRAQTASAQIAAPKVPVTLAAAIRADIKAQGLDYGGDCKFDVMYLAPGKWCSMVQSVGADGAVVTYGPFASGDIRTANFVRKGEYGWVNPATGVGSPERVPALSAQPGAKADSWVITGINFPAGQDVTFFDGSGCGGEQRCPTDHRLVTVKAGADGAFEVTLQLEPSAKPLPGQVNRLIQAGDAAFIQVAFHHSGSAAEPTPAQPTPANPAPAQPVPTDPTPTTPASPATPAPGAPTPSNPAPEADDDDSDGDGFLYAGIAALGLAAVGAFGIVTVARRK